MRTISLAIVVSAVLAATAAYSQSADTSVLKLPQDIEFQSSSRAGSATNRCFVRRSNKAGSFRDPRKVLARLEGSTALAPR